MPKSGSIERELQFNGPGAPLVQGSDILLAIAEVSVAFAGFASIVVMFQHRAPGAWPRSVVVRLRTMVEGSLLTLFATILPFLVYHLGASGSALWPVSSSILMVALVLFTIRVVLWSRSLLAAKELNRRFTVVVLTITSVAIGALLSNVLAAPSERDFGLYLLAVAWTLGFASLMFLRVITYPGEHPKEVEP